MNILDVIRKMSLLALCALSSSVQADMRLHSLALHHEYGSPIFIAALLSEPTEIKKEQWFNNGHSRKMEMRILAPRFSYRRFNKLWTEGAAINNSRDTLTNQAANMVRFTRMINGPLISGDQLSINSNGEVSLNETLLGVIDDPDFFNLLLKTWIGAVPLSSKFRDQLLNNPDNDEALMARFTATQPSDARRNEVSTWKKPNDLAMNLPEPPPSPIEPAKTDSLPEFQNNRPPATDKDKVTPPELHSTRQHPLPPTTVAIATDSAEPLTASSPLVETQVSEQDAVDLLLKRQLYQSDLMRWTYKHIRYPKKAVKRNQQGSIRAQVTIDRTGGVTEFKEIESSKHALLNKEARLSIKRASPYPAIPDEISGTEFTFTLPIVFKLQ